MKTLYVLDHPRFYEACRRHAASHQVSEFSVFCPQIKQHAVPEDMKARMAEIPVFTPEERAFIDLEAEKWAGRWHQMEAVRQKAMHGGLNMAEMLEHGLDYFFVWLFKQRVGALKLLQTERPSRVFIAKQTGCKGPFSAPRESYYSYFFEESARTQNISSEVFAEHTASEARSFFEPGYGFRTRLASSLMNFCSGILLVLQPGPRAAVLSSMRVAAPLLERRLSRARWMAVTFGPSPRTFLKLFLKGIPTWTVLPRPAAGRREGTEWTGDFFPAASARFENIFKADVPALAAWTDALETFFQARKIELAVLDEDVTALHRLFVQLAEKHLVPCTVVQHGITGNRRGYAPSQSSAVAVWGEISKKQLEGWGLPARRIHITGFPALEKYTDTERASIRTRVREKLGAVRRGEKLVVFAPCRLRQAEHGFLGVKMSREQNTHFLRAVVQTMARLPEHLLVVKLHPGEDMAYVKRILQGLDLSRVRLLSEYDLQDLLAACDAMIVSVSSTVSVEAMAMDIPVIDWDPFDMYRPSYDLAGSVVHTRTQEDLERSILSALADRSKGRAERKRFVEAYCGPSQGEPAERVIQLLESLSTPNHATPSLKENIECVSY